MHINKVAKGDIKRIKIRKILRGGDNMEMRKQVTNTYKVVDRKKALEAMIECSEKYDKTLKELAK